MEDHRLPVSPEAIADDLQNAIPLMEQRHETGLLVPVGLFLVAHFINVENEMGRSLINAVTFRK
jgi:hypothetical protein